MLVCERGLSWECWWVIRGEGAGMGMWDESWERERGGRVGLGGFGRLGFGLRLYIWGFFLLDVDYDCLDGWVGRLGSGLRLYGLFLSRAA